MSEPDLDRTAPQAARPLQMGQPGRDGYATLLHSFTGAVSADAGWLVLIGDSAGAVSPLSAWDPEGLGEPQRWLGGRFLSRLIERRRPLALYGGGADAHTTDPTANGPDRIVGAVGAPVSVPEAGDVALCAGFASHPAEKPPQLLWATDRFAAVAALHLQDIGGFARVIRGSVHDSLTGCLTYGGLIDAVDSEISRSVRRRHSLSCCFLDIDDFKKVNRSKGHLMGNRVLAAVGESLRDRIRPYDVVGRFGGDEFVVLLPETSGRDARRLAERLCRAVREAASTAAEMPVDVAFGQAEWTDGMSTDDFLQNADRALARAKHANGNGNGELPAAPDQGRDRDLDVELDRIFEDRSMKEWWHF
jgi:diguanylate cyclase (GGDEF)-like protein